MLSLGMDSGDFGGKMGKRKAVITISTGEKFDVYIEKNQEINDKCITFHLGEDQTKNNSHIVVFTPHLVAVELENTRNE